ncbi:MAG: 3'(2'),5'-bisphosphate nucleotidase CysQ [Rhizobiales bacterium]|nr:3'(2'),5'-bisphosphate nucleotidase CysQ [Hyphomicrobiales bacterium]
MDEHSGFAAKIEPTLVEALARLAAEAARSILAIRAGELDVRVKADGSPATAADEAAEAIILAGLARILPGIPIVSEEQAGREGYCSAPTFLLVDPLDGTREFLAGRDEFTVNIALIVDTRPALGIVAAPARKRLWSGATGRGAERRTATSDWEIDTERSAIRTRKWPADAPVALVSRSHLDERTSAFLSRFPGIKTESSGSALKFCRLAEGTADLYPRLARTCEWDIAAGHALLAAAGGAVITEQGVPMRYGQRDSGDCYVPSFIAFADPAIASRVIAT